MAFLVGSRVAMPPSALISQRSWLVQAYLRVLDAQEGGEPLGRARQPGGGRKRLAEVNPGLRPALLALVEPDERGDPMSPLRWTC